MQHLGSERGPPNPQRVANTEHPQLSPKPQSNLARPFSQAPPRPRQHVGSERGPPSPQRVADTEHTQLSPKPQSNLAHPFSQARPHRSRISSRLPPAIHAARHQDRKKPKGLSPPSEGLRRGRYPGTDIQQNKRTPKVFRIGSVPSTPRATSVSNRVSFPKPAIQSNRIKAWVPADKASPAALWSVSKRVVPPEGFEPSTKRLRVFCSTN